MRSLTTIRWNEEDVAFSVGWDVCSWHFSVYPPQILVYSNDVLSVFLGNFHLFLRSTNSFAEFIVYLLIVFLELNAYKIFVWQMKFSEIKNSCEIVSSFVFINLVLTSHPSGDQFTERQTSVVYWTKCLLSHFFLEAKILCTSDVNENWSSVVSNRSPTRIYYTCVFFSPFHEVIETPLWSFWSLLL